MTYSIKIACTGSSEHYAISSEAPQQLLIVDNMPPDPPIFTTTSNSYKLLVNTWSSSDADLSSYTVINPSAGYNGIKSYSIVFCFCIMIPRTSSTLSGNPSCNCFICHSDSSATGLPASLTALRA